MSSTSTLFPYRWAVLIGTAAFMFSFGLGKISRTKPTVETVKIEKRKKHQVESTGESCESALVGGPWEAGGSVSLADVQQAACQQQNFWLAQSCRLGNANSCFGLYSRVLKGTEEERALFNQVALLLEKECKNDLFEFDNFIKTLEKNNHSAEAKRCVDLRTQVLQQDCEAEKWQQCDLLVALDAKWADRVSQMKQHRCEQGDLIACNEGLLILSFTRKPPNPQQTQALKIIEDSCSRGNSLACAFRAQHEIVNNDDKSRNPWADILVGQIDEPCKTADLNACPILKELFQGDGKGKEAVFAAHIKNGSLDLSLKTWIPARWLPAWKKKFTELCDSGKVEACQYRPSLGEIAIPEAGEDLKQEAQRRANEEEKNTSRIIQGLKSMCDRGEPNACSVLLESRELHITNDAQRESIKKKRDEIEKIECQKGSIQSCQDRDDFREWCNRGNADACWMVSVGYSNLCHGSW